MATIRQEDFIASIADALQFMSYYHPQDYIEALGEAYKAEQSAAAKDAIAQILTNSRMCAEGHRPICQDTGIVVAFVKVGMNVRWEGASMSIADMVNEGVRRAPISIPTTSSVRRSSPIPAGARKNTRDNTPAVVHFDVVPGDTVEVKIAAKGGGSENKANFVMLNPVGLDRRLGARDRAGDGRRLVSARNARHRHRRHRGEGDGPREGGAARSYRHPRAQGAAGRRARPRSSASSSSRRSTRSASAPRDLGGLSTVLDVKSSTIRRTRCRSPLR
jgi:hypothetical protein